MIVIVFLTFSFIVRASQGSDLIFSTKLSQNEWMGNLLNPCNAADSAASMGDLNVSGRHFEMKVVAGNIKSRLQGCKNDLVSVKKLTSFFYGCSSTKSRISLQLSDECPAEVNLHSLSAMESAENSSMEVIFKRALLMSAHFKYMAEDWRNGRECSSDDAKRNLIQAFDR